jgi:hypothetical protein
MTDLTTDTSERTTSLTIAFDSCDTLEQSELIWAHVLEILEPVKDPHDLSLIFAALASEARAASAEAEKAWTESLE